MATRQDTTEEIVKDFSVLQRTGESALVDLSIFERLKERLFLFIATMGIDLVFLLFMTALLVGAIVTLDGSIRVFQASVGLPLGIMAAVIIMKSIQSPRKFATNVPLILRDWVPFLFIAFIYENLHDVAGRFMHYDIADLMYKWDVLIFGVEPTIWAQKLYSPWLTDTMAADYALYFALPLAIMFFLSLSGQRRDFRRMVLCLSFVFMMGFVCYVLFPCSPPRYFITEMYTNPHQLKGLFLFNRLQGMLDGFSVIKGGAFPSLHVGISAVALIYAYRFRNRSGLNKFIWFLYMPLVTGLWFSTVYLRHHWVVDIIAGLMVTLISYFLADWLLHLWERLRRRYSLPLID